MRTTNTSTSSNPIHGKSWISRRWSERQWGNPIAAESSKSLNYYVEGKASTNTSSQQLPAPDSQAPGRMSITTYLSSNNGTFQWGLELVKHEETGEVSLLGLKGESSCSRSRYDEALLQPGDVLESINYCSCKELELEDVYQVLDAGRGFVTLVAIRPTGNNDIASATFFTHSRDSDGSADEYDMSAGIGFVLNNNSKLQVSSIAIDGIMAHSVLQQGDVLFSINNIPCQDLSPDDAQRLLDAKSRADQQITIQVLQNIGNTKSSRFRKAAVAVGGGAMVTVGAAIMVTPLHPIGHVIAIGGVGVLGSEFEGPRRAMVGAKKSAQGAIDRMKAARSSSSNLADISSETTMVDESVSSKGDSHANEAEKDLEPDDNIVWYPSRPK